MSYCIFPPVLDVCCGPRMFWFDHDDERAVFMDRRRETWIVDKGTPGTIGRSPSVTDPQVLSDFISIPFPDESFSHIVFDPPHYSNASMGINSDLSHKYGMLIDGWEESIKEGFCECFRVLKPCGTLVFKWCSNEIPLSRVLQLTEKRPLYGHRSGKSLTTHWLSFLK